MSLALKSLGLLFCVVLACSSQNNTYQPARAVAVTPVGEGTTVIPPQPTTGSFLAGVLTDSGGVVIEQAKITLTASGTEITSQANGGFAIPVAQIDAAVVPMRIQAQDVTIEADVTLPADVVGLVSKARLDAGLSPLPQSFSPAPSAPLSDPSASLPLARRVAIELSVNQIEGGGRRNLNVYSLPYEPPVPSKRVGTFNKFLIAGTTASVHFSWEKPLAQSGVVRIAFAKSESEISAWDGRAESAPQWNEGTPVSALITDFSQCTDSNFRGLPAGVLKAEVGGQCGFLRSGFPFSGNGLVYVRGVAELGSDILFSKVYSVSRDNVAPLLSAISDQLFDVNGSKTVNLSLTDDVPISSCAGALKVDSSNPKLLPAQRISINGTPPDCKILLSPLPDQAGQSRVTVTASDGSLSTSRSFTFVTAGWFQEAYIKAANADKNDRFGGSVSISGDTLAAGAFGESSDQVTITNGSTASSSNTVPASGAVYVYRRRGSSWGQEAFIKAANANSNDAFGWSVAVSGDVLAVGAYGESSSQQTIFNGSSADSNNSVPDAGAVYVYRRAIDSWVQEAYIKAENADAGDIFGANISLSGNFLAVAATSESSNQATITSGSGASGDNSFAGAGAVYVFRRSNQQWSQDAFIKASNANAGDQFGSSLALSGDTLVVGAVGEASNLQTITNGPTASTDNSVPLSGAVYVYRRNGNTWTQQAYIKAGNANVADSFGISVALSGDTLAVGAVDESSNQTTITNGDTASADNSASQSGAVYVYRRTGTQWQQESYIKAANANSGDFFGSSLSLSGNSLVVGASGEASKQNVITNGNTASSDNSSSRAGAAYVYRRNGSEWVQAAYLKAANVTANDYFGSTVATSGDTIVVNAISESSSVTTITNGTTAVNNRTLAGAGAVYVYRNLAQLMDPDVRISSVENTKITFEWSATLGSGQHVKIAPAVNGGRAPAVGCSAAESVTLTSGTTSYTYTGLVAGTKYGFRFCSSDGSAASAGTTVWFNTL